MTKTGATGKISRQVSYEVKLFIATGMRSRRRSMYRVRKPDAEGKYRKEVGRKEDLLTLDKPLRLYIFDNTAWDGKSTDDKDKFYDHHKLKDLINVFVPLRLEVNKFIANKEVEMDRHDDVQAVFEIEDPAEELDIIEGPRPGNPRSRTGRKFVESLKSRTQLGGLVGSGNDDNCIGAFAPALCKSQCRTKGSKVSAPDVLWKRGKTGKYVGKLDNHPSDANLAVAPVSWRRQRARVGFHPPPILGNNYRIKVNLEKKGKYLFAEAFSTPTITVWRRVKIQLVARQEGFGSKAMKWKQLKNVYHDAFIHPAGPFKNVVISKEKWIEYLDKHVYNTWLRTAWQRYRTLDGGKKLLEDITSYSFPQATELEERFVSDGVKTSYKLKEKPMKGSVQVFIQNHLASTTLAEEEDFTIDYGKNSMGFHETREGASFAWAPPRGVKIFVKYFTHKGIVTVSGQTLTPPDDDPADPDHTSHALLSKLTEQIIHEKLPKKWIHKKSPKKDKINKVKKGARIGICALFCLPTSSDAETLGVYLSDLGPKRFYMVKDGDVTVTFAHEMGHALFLNHGATEFIFDINNKKFKPIIVETGPSGSSGPYWDQHHSEDIIQCLMSYINDFYDKEGKKLKKNATDWHFCGVCLLLLRFYSHSEMSDNRRSPESFRRLNYSRKPKIAECVYKKPSSGAKELDKWVPRARMTVKKGETKRLFAVYPQEPVKNNYGRKFWKDICHHSRGKWVSSMPGKAEVKVRLDPLDDVYIAELNAKNPTDGKPVRIEFQMFHGPGSANVIKSKPLWVTVKG